MAWKEGSIIGVRDDWPGGASLVFINTYTNMYMTCGSVVQPITPNQWYPINLAPLKLPADVIGIKIREILILTDGQNSGIPDIATAWCAPSYSSTLTPANYVDQTCAIGPAGGSRSNSGDWVPVENLEIMFAWLRGDGASYPDKPLAGNWPQAAAYGLNATIDAYMRP